MIPPIDWTARSTAGMSQTGFSQLTVSSVAALEFHAKYHEDGYSSQQTKRPNVIPAWTAIEPA